jgi:hypothetical protein
VIFFGLRSDGTIGAHGNTIKGLEYKGTRRDLPRVATGMAGS